MRIERVHVRNFRCHRDFEISLEGCTVLLGANGAGKSSVLDALEFFFDKTLDASDIHGDGTGEVSVEVSFGELTPADRTAFGLVNSATAVTLRRVSLEGRIRLLARTSTLPLFDERVRAQSGALPRRKAYNELREERPDLQLSAANVIAEVEAAMSAWERANPDLCVATETDASSALGVNAEAALDGRLRFFRVEALGEAATETTSPKGLLRRLLTTVAEARAQVVAEATEMTNRFQAEYDSLIAPKHTASLDALTAGMTAKMREYIETATIELSAANAVVRLPEPAIALRAGEGGELTEIENQGHGFQRTFLIAALQLLADTEAAHPDAPSIFLAVEEPELFQHPPRARHVGRVLGRLADRPDVQVAYTTHSPYLIDGRHFERIRLFRRAPDGTRTVSSAQPERVVELAGREASEHWKVGRTLDVAFNEALFASAALLLEGTDDIGAIRGTSDRMGIDFDALGIVLLEGSKSMIPIKHAILDALGIPTYFVFDVDQRGDGTFKSPETPHENRLLQQLAGIAEPVDAPPQGAYECYACFGNNLDEHLESVRPGIGGRIGKLASRIGKPESQREILRTEPVPLLETIVQHIVDRTRSG